MVEHRNSFDALRLLAALMVFVGHQHGMLKLDLPLVPMIGLPIEGVGVLIFFFVSGYLISLSILGGASIRYYAASRLLRIYPGLIVALLSCLALGAVIGTLPLGQYLTDPGTGQFLFGNILPFFQKQPIALPGVLENAHWPAVNGSLWTIKYELICYIIFAAFCLVPKWRKTAMACAVTLFFVVFAFTMPGLKSPPADVLFIWVNSYFFLLFTFCFCLGSAVALLTKTGHFDFRIAAAAAAVAVFAFRDTDLGRVANLVLVCLVVLGLARRKLPFVPSFSRVGDLSYGLYLYAYPISNVSATYLQGVLPIWGIYAVSVTAVFAAAWLSWTLIEAPALMLRNRFRAVAARAAAPMTAAPLAEEAATPIKNTA